MLVSNNYYLYGNSVVVARLKCENVRLTRDERLQCKLHLDVGMNGTDVSVQTEAVRVEPNVNVNTNISTWSQVACHSRSLSAIDLSRRTLLHVFHQVARKTHNRHSTHHLAALWLCLAKITRLKQNQTSVQLLLKYIETTSGNYEHNSCL